MSTPLQKVDRQITDIKKVCPDGIVIEDTYSGTTMERPGWLKLMKKVEQGKVTDIYMDELSRMGRTKEEGYKCWMWLYEKNIELHFIKQPQVDTLTYREAISNSLHISTENLDKATSELMISIIDGINKYMIELARMQIYQVFDEAQFERDMLSQRTSEGLKVAKLNGKRVGRQKGERIVTKKSKKAKAKIKKFYKKYGGVLNATDCMRICEISRDTFYTYIREIDEETAGNKTLIVLIIFLKVYYLLKIAIFL